MQNLTDSQMIDLYIDYLHSITGLLVSCIALLVLISIIGLTVGFFRAIAQIKTV
jgi:flagellar biosynthesis protein FliQ